MEHPVFTKVCATHAAGLTESDPRLNDLFAFTIKVPNASLKIIRLNQTGITFRRYAFSPSYSWDPDQDRKVLQSGLGGVPDPEVVDYLEHFHI